MLKEIRKNTRFETIGRVSAQSLCLFPGIILNISLEGCRVRFPAIVNPDIDKDYELTVSFSEKDAPDGLILLGHIKWLETTEESTEIGVNFLHSPSSKPFADFINKLQLEDQESVCLT
ncbi:MAG: hypothetical protein BKP49_05705 [Treponema sp. CETP13]|nr:MAG: hypothetical protein BKP49_05705 [Treponema sp. CETP13]